MSQTNPFLVPLSRMLLVIPSRFRQRCLSVLLPFILVVTGLMGTVSVHAADVSKLTETERAWVVDQGPVSMCVDPDWLPFEKIDDQGKHIGIAADYFKLFSEFTGLTFELVITDSWAQSEEFAQAGKCKILSLLNQSEERAVYLNFTSPYLSSPVVIVSRDNQPYLDGLKAIGNRSISMVEGYVYKELIERDFPHINLHSVTSSDQTLQEVSEGRVFATIGSLYIVTERIQRMGLANLKIAGPTEYRNDFRVGVIKGEDMLLSVMEKAVAAINPIEETDILSRWVKVKYEIGQDYGLAMKVAVVSFIVFILLAYRSLVLTRYNRKLSEAYELLERRTDELDRLSHTDALTSIHNRLRLDEALTSEVNRYKRYRNQFSLIILDIDYFKKVNDNFGHPIGDRVMIDLCRLIKDQLRSTDVFGRWGGEEFLIVCPATSKDEAIIIAEKLRRAIDSTHFEPIGHLTVSFGVTSIREGDGEKEIVSRADRELYRAKSEGRNRVCHD